MEPSSQHRTQIRARIREELALYAQETLPDAHNAALRVFFNLSLEYESLRDFKSLCVLVPDVCLRTPASLYLRGAKDKLLLRRTTNTAGQTAIALPEPDCNDSISVIRQDGASIVSLCELTPRTRLLGLLCLHRTVHPSEERFLLDYAHAVAGLMALKQSAIGSRQRLTFINTLVRDIGHNVIVPNMHFKLLFMHMDKHLKLLSRKILALSPLRPDTPDREIRQELPALVDTLQEQLDTISQRFQHSSLFLESLLRRSHFEKGTYDLQSKPCKFKSQIIEPQIDRFRSLLRDQSINVRIAPEVRIDEDVTLDADLGLISQVFANLLANAVKYTQPTPASSSASEKLLLYGWKSQHAAFGPHKPGVQLFVSTTGPAIPAQDIPRLFESDFRSQGSTLTDGSGHGLFFVKQIVELHKGRVGYSHADGMNTFHITLPSPSSGGPTTELHSCSTPF